MTLAQPTRAVALIGAWCLGVSLLLAGPATADTTTSPSTTAQLLGDYAVAPPTDLDTAAEVVTSRAAGGRLAVGDSLMVGATSLMRRQGFAIHARVGRQFSTAPGIVSGYGTRLPRNVVIELGTNGTISLAACRRVVRLAGPERRVFLVTNRVPRSWQDPNNATLRRCDRSFARSRVRLIDWHGASAGHTEWFAADGVHTSAAGRVAFARLIDRTVDRHGR